ncbi:MAG: ACT domain-containing protein [Candidatus Micrarchaeia archaeon]
MDLRMYKRPVALITVTGEKVRIVPGVLARLSQALADRMINIYCVGTGEYSVTFAVDQADGKRAHEALSHVIIKDCAFDAVTMRENVAMITITGGEVAEQPGVLVRLTEPLARKFINILGVSSSYDSLTILVDWDDRDSSFKLIESAFEKGALIEYIRPDKAERARPPPPPSVAQ